MVVQKTYTDSRQAYAQIRCLRETPVYRVPRRVVLFYTMFILGFPGHSYSSSVNKLLICNVVVSKPVFWNSDNSALSCPRCTVNRYCVLHRVIDKKKYNLRYFVDLTIVKNETVITRLKQCDYLLSINNSRVVFGHVH